MDRRLVSCSKHGKKLGIRRSEFKPNLTLEILKTYSINSHVVYTKRL